MLTIFGRMPVCEKSYNSNSKSKRYLRWHRHLLLDVCKIRLRRLFLAALILSLI